MNVDRAVMALAGTMVLIGVALAALVSTWWLALPLFVGLNLVQASITAFCPAARLFQRVGLKSGAAFR